MYSGGIDMHAASLHLQFLSKEVKKLNWVKKLMCLFVRVCVCLCRCSWRTWKPSSLSWTPLTTSTSSSRSSGQLGPASVLQWCSVEHVHRRVNWVENTSISIVTHSIDYTVTTYACFTYIYKVSTTKLFFHTCTYLPCKYFLLNFALMRKSENWILNFEIRILLSFFGWMRSDPVG